MWFEAASALSWVGHLSFALMAASFLMRDILYLRIFALVSGATGILYNSAIALGWIGPANPELWNVVAWLVLFFVINVVQSALLLVQHTEVRLSEAQRLLLAQTFPLMRSRDFATLMRAAERVRLSPGEVLLEMGAQTEHLHMVESGHLTCEAQHQSRRLGQGQMVGEISLAIGEQYGGSSERVRASQTGEVVLLRWEYVRLREMEGDAAFKAALFDGFVRGMVKKARLLRMDESNPDMLPSAPALQLHERIMHPCAFPSLDAEQFAYLLSLGQRSQHAAGSQMCLDGKLVLLLRGSVRVQRADCMSIDLGAGNFLGEVEFFAHIGDKVGVRLQATDTTDVCAWDASVLKSLASSTPRLYALVVQDLAANMAYKLTRPLKRDGACAQCGEAPTFVVQSQADGDVAYALLR